MAPASHRKTVTVYSIASYAWKRAFDARRWIGPQPRCRGGAPHKGGLHLRDGLGGQGERKGLGRVLPPLMMANA